MMGAGGQRAWGGPGRGAGHGAARSMVRGGSKVRCGSMARRRSHARCGVAPARGAAQTPHSRSIACRMRVWRRHATPTPQSPGRIGSSVEIGPPGGAFVDLAAGGASIAAKMPAMPACPPPGNPPARPARLPGARNPPARKCPPAPLARNPPAGQCRLPAANPRLSGGARAGRDRRVSRAVCDAPGDGLLCTGPELQPGTLCESRCEGS